MDAPSGIVRPREIVGGLVGAIAADVIGLRSRVPRAREVSASPRVTVINDNPEFLALIGDILSSDHFVATLLDEDRPDALERASRSDPDILMIDLSPGLGRLRGWDIAQALRRDPELARLPILVCSGDYYAKELLGEDAPTDTHIELLRKPFALHQLTDAIQRLLGPRPPGVAPWSFADDAERHLRRHRTPDPRRQVSPSRS